MKKASWLSAIVLMGTLGLPAAAAAKDNGHNAARDEHPQVHDFHPDRNQGGGHGNAWRQRQDWQQRARAHRDHERAAWAREHHHNNGRHEGWDRGKHEGWNKNGHQPPPSAALRQPASPGGTGHYHQYHRPLPAHVAPPSAQGK